ncbi:MAG: AAA family ATPase [Desulfobacterales bacterium]|nr:AAA family ATPase [Desulfobacterales bacterium]
MIEVQVAGAGAGKTHGLSKKVAERLQKLEIPKKIFALTYTNKAKEKIETELLKQIGYEPENIYIETVHSFFLNEIIFPFSGYILGDIYRKASILYLGNKVRYKASKIKALKDKGEIHVEKVYSVAKQIIDKQNPKNISKANKTRVDRVLAILTECIDSIFVDEVQDLDSDALRVFEILGSNAILVYMIGDPKQAIKWSHDFNNFIKKHKCDKSEHFTFLKVNNLTRRVPNEILFLSNRFCYEDQQQQSLSEITGSVSYIESNHDEFDRILQMHINSDSIVCIDKKQGKYLTGDSYKYCFPASIEEKIIEAEPIKDKKLIVKAAFNEFISDAHKRQKQAVNKFVKRFGIKLDKKEFAQMYELCETQKNTIAQYKISSIDAVKGIEADCCVIVLTPNTYKYLIQKDIDENHRFNKEWNKLYVALTRSMRELIIVVDHSLFKEESLIEVRRSIEGLGVKRF